MLLKITILLFRCARVWIDGLENARQDTISELHFQPQILDEEKAEWAFETTYEQTLKLCGLPLLL